MFSIIFSSATIQPLPNSPYTASMVLGNSDFEVVALSPCERTANQSLATLGEILGKSCHATLQPALTALVRCSEKSGIPLHLTVNRYEI